MLLPFKKKMSLRSTTNCVILLMAAKLGFKASIIEGIGIFQGNSPLRVNSRQ